ncbi:kinesin-like protein KIF18A [Bombina bombina]|uniref:kinesin-like protein KIF18A n=1 Tax=Bombina bombina TaxID=8345 RepID=UPI00235AEE4E|nr:kinesin-like protein KIF18A [Bombina bombina]
MATGVGDVCSHVRVVVRVRPENQKEGSFSKAVQVVDKHILVFDPKVEEVSFFHGKTISNRHKTNRKNKDLKFVFDRVFDDHSTQMEVFEETTKHVLDGVLNGYNCTVLAYGATGAGKTHTMLGSSDEPGVMYLTMMDLYNRINSLKEEKICDVAISYLEVYNEQIRDLLVKSGPLAVREDAQKGVVVQGLTLHEPKSAQEVLQMLDYGNKNRTQHPTDANATSSRSHAVFQIYLRQQDKTASINQNVRIAKMCLIDLAGSERANATKAKGERLREGANINRSLLALGNVINALADPKSKTQHIPYRNSKLTRLLKDSLGGNCRTIMIAAVSPSSLSYDDTYNTLRYANRAKDIQSSVKSNVVSLDSHISQYVKICEQQKQEIAILKDKLQRYENQKVSTADQIQQYQCTSQEQAKTKRCRDTLRCLFANREETRLAFLNLEMRLKENQLKMSYQKQHLEQIHVLCSLDKTVKATCKRRHRLEVLKNQLLLLQNKKEEEQKRLEENTNWLHRVENEMRLLTQDKQIPEELSRDLQYCHLKLEVTDLKSQIDHMTRLVSLQERENKHNEKLLNTLLPSFRRQYLLLNQAGLVNASIEADYKEIEQLVQREKSVVWADQTVLEDPNTNDIPEVAALVTFPQLTYNQTTPCKTETWVQRINIAEKDDQHEQAVVKPFIGELSLQPIDKKEKISHKPLEATFPCKKTRRKLLVSPLQKENVEASHLPKSNPLNYSISNECAPIVYTPESCNKTLAILKQVAQIPCLQKKIENPVNVTSEDKGNIRSAFNFRMPTESENADMNSTVILSQGNNEIHLEPIPDLHVKGQPSISISQRVAVHSLLNKSSGKQNEIPSYMAMTSAAERKRKLLSSTVTNVLKEEQSTVPAAKRVRQNVSFDCKALRVRRAVGTLKNKDKVAPRRIPRSISEGNMMFGTKKKHFSFLGSTQSFMQASKNKLFNP